MSTNNLSFYGEISQKILQLSPYTHLNKAFRVAQLLVKEATVEQTRNVSDDITQTCPTFKGCQNHHFLMKKFDIFLIFAQNKDCGYTLELPQSNE